jgi:DNA polymerase-3 subunit delta'
MPFQNILGHDRIAEQFRRALARGRLASTFLFVGPPGVGKRAFALKLVQGLLCDTNPPEQLEPCGHCPACSQVAAGSHPDVEVVGRPGDKAFIPLATFIGEDERRNREGLCYNISLKPFSGKRRIAIIDDVDYLNVEGANCLLKTLEEPPPGAVLILISTSEQRQLPTIRSRCQAIRFRPLSEADVESILLSLKLVESPVVAKQAAARSGGSVERALEMTDPALAEYQMELLDQITRREFDTPALAKATTSFIESAGKEAPAKRARLKQAIGVASDFYRELMLSGTRPAPAGPFGKAVTQAQRWWPGGDEAAAWCLEACLDAAAAVDANANQATLVECWLDELGQIGRTGRPVAAA